jgi:hypothetical protein
VLTVGAASGGGQAPPLNHQRSMSGTSRYPHGTVINVRDIRKLVAAAEKNLQVGHTRHRDALGTRMCVFEASDTWHITVYAYTVCTCNRYTAPYDTHNSHVCT